VDGEVVTKKKSPSKPNPNPNNPPKRKSENSSGQNDRRVFWGLVIAIIGVIVAIIAIVIDDTGSRKQVDIYSTQIALLMQIKDVESALATLQSVTATPGNQKEATAIAQQMQDLKRTQVALSSLVATRSFSIPESTKEKSVPTSVTISTNDNHTSTPTIVDTPIPTKSPVSENILEILGAECIRTEFWEPHFYDTETTDHRIDGCWDLSSWGIKAKESSLLLDVKGIHTELRSIFARMPKNKDLDIRFSINIAELGNQDQTNASNSQKTDDAALIFGIGNSDDWALNNGHYLIYNSTMARSYKEIRKQIGSGKINPEWDLGVVSPNQLDEVVFSIKGNSLYVFLNNERLDQIYNLGTYYPKQLSQIGNNPVFWIGYQLPAGTGFLQAFLTNLTIETK
jgi:hypothetical protein